MIKGKPKKKFYAFLDWVAVAVVLYFLFQALFSKGGVLGGF